MNVWIESGFMESNRFRGGCPEQLHSMLADTEVKPNLPTSLEKIGSVHLQGYSGLGVFLDELHKDRDELVQSEFPELLERINLGVLLGNDFLIFGQLHVGNEPVKLFLGIGNGRTLLVRRLPTNEFCVLAGLLGHTQTATVRLL